MGYNPILLIYFVPQTVVMYSLPVRLEQSKDRSGIWDGCARVCDVRISHVAQYTEMYLSAGMHV